MDSKPAYVHQCKHGNPTSNSCAFCDAEGTTPADREIPNASWGPSLPVLACPTCGYSTVYGDAMRRHVHGRHATKAQALVRRLATMWSNFRNALRG